MVITFPKTGPERVHKQLPINWRLFENTVKWPDKFLQGNTNPKLKKSGSEWVLMWYKAKHPQQLCKEVEPKRAQLALHCIATFGMQKQEEDLWFLKDSHIIQIFMRTLGIADGVVLPHCLCTVWLNQVVWSRRRPDEEGKKFYTKIWNHTTVNIHVKVDQDLSMDLQYIRTFLDIPCKLVQKGFWKRMFPKFLIWQFINHDKDFDIQVQYGSFDENKEY